MIPAERYDMRISSILPILISLAASCGDAVADRMRITITGTVETSGITRGPFASARAGQHAVAVFEVDSAIYLNSAQYPVRGYAINAAAFTLTVGTASTGMRIPLPSGTVPYFILQNDDPQVDGFYLASTLVDYPGSIPLNGGSGVTMNMSFLRGFDVGTILRSLNIVDASNQRWGFEHMSSYDWTVGVTGNAPMLVTYETIAIDNLTNPPFCAADFNSDGGVDGADVEAFFLTWADGLPQADVNQDGGVDGPDIEAFFRLWMAGGC